MSEKKKKKRRNLYDILNNGNDKKGVEKTEDDGKRGIFYFFKLFGRRFGVMVELNILYLLANFPLFFLLFALSGYAGKTTTAPASALFPALHSVISSGNANPLAASLYGIHGIQSTMMINTTLSYVFYALSLLLIFTFGLSTLGVTYNLRNIVKGEPLFILSDFFEVIRKNLKQGIIMGIIDIAVIALLILDFTVYTGYMKYIAIGIFVIYFIMRFYIYILIPTFNLSIFKVLKNSMIFVVLNIKRNIAAFFGIAFVIAINIVLLDLYFPIGILLPFALTVSSCMFIGVYAAWPSIDEIMIEPYTEEKEEKEEEPIFTDRG